MPVRPAIIPCLVYADAPKAIDFLCDAFGFTRHAVHADGDTVHHAQLMLEGNIIMLSTAGRHSHDRFKMVSIGEIDGKSALCICVVLDDPDAHHAVAKAAGADIVDPPHDNPFGGRSYEARDSEGVVWSFGSYDPFVSPS
jgi:uncharacterized glyoxalase superfamily protein PhnB